VIRWPSGPTGRSALPPELLVPVLIAAGGALLFVLSALVRSQVDGDGSLLKFPIVIAVLELLVAGGLVARFKPARITGCVVFTVVALVHLLIVLAAAPWWVRVLSGVLSAAHVYGFVLLSSGPARAHLGGRQ
jgi:hypothetical protein